MSVEYKGMFKATQWVVLKFDQDANAQPPSSPLFLSRCDLQVCFYTDFASTPGAEV